jgi:hypothetical protein
MSPSADRKVFCGQVLAEIKDLTECHLRSEVVTLLPMRGIIDHLRSAAPMAAKDFDGNPAVSVYAVEWLNFGQLV